MVYKIKQGLAMPRKNQPAKKPSNTKPVDLSNVIRKNKDWSDYYREEAANAYKRAMRVKNPERRKQRMEIVRIYRDDAREFAYALSLLRAAQRGKAK